MPARSFQAADFAAELGQPMSGFSSSVPVLHSEYTAGPALDATAKSNLTDVIITGAACHKPCRHS